MYSIYSVTRAREVLLLWSLPLGPGSHWVRGLHPPAGFVSRDLAVNGKACSFRSEKAAWHQMSPLLDGFCMVVYS